MVVLAFALLPADAPRARTAGSAFDPSTQTVALKQRSGHLQRARQHDSDPASKPSISPTGSRDGASIALLAIPALSPMLADHGLRLFFPLRAAALSGRGVGILRARAPPAF